MVERIREPAREMPVRHEVDVLVVGGGSAGLAAAVTAARLGARVLLVERYGFLGGTLTAVSLGSICGLFTVDGEKIIPVVRGFAEELVERLRRVGGAGPPLRWFKTASVPYDLFAVKTTADALIQEAGVSLCLHCLAVDCLVDDGVLRGVIFEGKDGRWACRAGVVIDCTGDADIAARAGADYALAVEDLQYPTCMFRFGGVRTEAVSGIGREDLHGMLEEAVRAGFDLPRTAGGMFSVRPGVVHLNITRVGIGDRAPNPVDTAELTEAELTGRAQVRDYEEAFRRFVPGFENCFVVDSGAQLGIRESRRITGDYELTYDDVMEERRFDDAIACSAWPLEEHRGDRSTRWVWLSPGGYYHIPLRCLFPKGLRGLLVAGRCVSATHDAHASLRAAAVCMALGEAAGVTAALAAAERCDGRAVPARRVRDELRRRGARVD